MHVDRVDAVAVIDRTGCPIGMITGGDLVALMATRVRASLEETVGSDTNADLSPET